MTKTQPLPNTEITNALPPVQQYGFQNGANSAANSAFLSQIASNNEQMFLIDQHGGGVKSQLQPEIVVPQAPTHGMPKISPVGGNSNATNAAGTLTQSLANSQYDNMVGKGGGKSRKRRRYKRRKSTKKRKIKKIPRKKRTKHHRKHKKRKSRRHQKRG